MQYTLAQLMAQINMEAESCAANRKSGLRNLFTRKETLYNDCKNGLMQGKYKDALDAAYMLENEKTAQIDAAFSGSVGLSNQTIFILLFAFAAMIVVVMLYKKPF